jgi:hypothetical protein
MSRKSLIVLSRSLSLLIAAAATLLAGQAVAGKPTQPLTPGACLAAGIKPAVRFFGSGVLNVPPKVQFDFWIATDDTRCAARSVKVTWLYHLANKTTQANVKTVPGSTSFPQIIKGVTQHLYVNCTATANTYCKDASATISPSSTYGIVQGKGSASIGPLAP